MEWNSLNKKSVSSRVGGEEEEGERIWLKKCFAMSAMESWMRTGQQYEGAVVLVSLELYRLFRRIHSLSGGNRIRLANEHILI